MMITQERMFRIDVREAIIIMGNDTSASTTLNAKYRAKK
jgi:hypothetical protein